MIQALFYIGLALVVIDLLVGLFTMEKLKTIFVVGPFYFFAAAAVAVYIGL